MTNTIFIYSHIHLFYLGIGDGVISKCSAKFNGNINATNGQRFV